MKTVKLSIAVMVAVAALASSGAVNVTASRDYVDRKIMAVSNALDAAISSATPGSYSVVSNAAMNALSRSDAENTYATKQSISSKQDTLPYPTNAIPYAVISGDPLTNYATRAEIEAGWWSEWVVRNHGSIITNAEIIYYPETEYYQANVDGDFVSGVYASADATYIDFLESGAYLLTATRHRVAAPVPTKPEDIGAASIADATLTPQFGKWTFSSSPIDGFYEAVYDGGVWSLVVFHDGTSNTVDTADGAFDTMSLAFSSTSVTATRTLLGYQLGSQGDKLLAPTNDIVRTEVDPTVPSWAKSSAKPTYKWSEISERPQYIVTYVNSKTGVVVLNALDVGAIPTTGGVFKTARLHLGARLSVGTWTDSVQPFGQISGSGIAFAFGDNVHSEAANTMTLGVGALNTNAWSFIWNGDANRAYYPTIPSMSNPYSTRFNGGFFINPSVRTGMTNPLQNFWIGDTNLNDWIGALAPAPDLSGYLPKTGGEVTGDITFRTSSGLLGGKYLTISKDGIETGVAGTPNPKTFSFPDKSGTLTLLSDLDTCIRTTTTNALDMQVMEGVLRIDGTDGYGSLYLSGKSSFGMSGGMIYFSNGGSGLAITPEGVRRMSPGNFKEGLISFPTSSGTVALTSDITNCVAFVDAGAAIPSTGICLSNNIIMNLKNNQSVEWLPADVLVMDALRKSFQSNQIP